MRNGSCPTTVKTTAGPVTLERPKLRDTTERFASQLFGKAAVSKSTVSRICAEIKTQFEAWTQRRLDEVEEGNPEDLLAFDAGVQQQRAVVNCAARRSPISVRLPRQGTLQAMRGWRPTRAQSPHQGAAF